MKILKYITIAGLFIGLICGSAWAGATRIESKWADGDLYFIEDPDNTGGTLYIGEDDTGLDFKLYVETSGDYWLFDESADALLGVGVDLTMDDGDLTLQDGDILKFGDADDVALTWDSDSFNIVPTADDTGTIELGSSTKAIDTKWFDDASGYVLFDAGNHKVDVVAVEIELDEDKAIYFKDSAIHIQAIDDGHLDLTADTSIDVNGDIVVTGHSDGQVFHVNAFQFPNPGTDWTPGASGAELGASLSSKKVYLPLNFLKVGDEIASYNLVGDIVEANTVTLDCKLVSLNKADPLTTTDITNGGMTQQDADGNFDVAVNCDDTTVATDKQYYLEIEGTTGASDAIYVIGAEITINRKV
jgi:hypothetical protein